MNKPAKIIVLLVILVLSTAGLQVVVPVQANFIPNVSVGISSPVNGATVESAVLDVTVNFYAWGNASKLVVYNVDDQGNTTLPGVFCGVDEILGFKSFIELPNLPEGKHTVKVYAWVDVEDSPFTAANVSEVTFYINNTSTQVQLENLPHESSPFLVTTSPLKGNAGTADAFMKLQSLVIAGLVLDGVFVAVFVVYKESKLKGASSK
jgi:hypothetical protein